MTVQEKAIESALKKLDDQRINFGILDRFDVDENHAVTQALEEIKLYRALGTVEELKEAMEKQIPKKANVKGEEIGFSIYCPNCHSYVGYFTEGMNEPEQMKYCNECGQALEEY